jgi:magnesium transporter
MLTSQNADILVAQLMQASIAENAKQVQNLTKSIGAADLSFLLRDVATPQARFILENIEISKAATILAELEPEIRTPFLKTFAPEELAPLLNAMESDDIADMLNEQHDALFLEMVISMLDKRKADDVRELAHYDADCAGGLMSKELIKVDISWTVGQCLDEIKQQAERVKKIFSVYVVDAEGIFLGRVSLKTIIISDKETKVSAIYLQDVARVEIYQSQDEVVEMMQKHDLETIPVINVEGKLVGRVMIDDVLDVMKEQAEIDQRAMSGLAEDVDETDTIWKLSRARLPWLLIGMSGGLLGASFLGTFTKELLLVPAMAFFIPLITATGGNVGIQSSTVIIQTLAESRLYKTTWYQRLFKTIAVGLLNGIAISSLVFFFNYFVMGNTILAFVVSVALFAVVLLASITGTATPIILDRIGVNPALASGPFITTANDLLGLAVYFWVARLLL